MNNPPNPAVTVTQADELKNCPFCGSDEISHGSAYPGYIADLHGIVQCHSCDAYMLGGEEEDAIAAWNTRQSNPVAAGVGEGLREAITLCASHLREKAKGFRAAATAQGKKVGPLAMGFDAAADQLSLLTPDALLLGGDAMRGEG